MSGEIIEIPSQLRDFRFIRVKSNSKVPVDPNWQNTANYTFDDPILLEWIRLKNGNYGVLGTQTQIILDTDILLLWRLIQSNLPETFTVQTGSGGRHYYYYLDEPLDGNPAIMAHKKNIGNVQGEGKFAVGPHSIHPNGEKYKIIKDIPITQIAKVELEELLAPFIGAKKGIRPCFDVLIDKMIKINSYYNHETNLHLATELKAEGYDDLVILALFSYAEDYDERKTQKQLISIDISKTAKCETIRSFGHCLEDDCNIYKKQQEKNFSPSTQDISPSTLEEEESLPDYDINDFVSNKIILHKLKNGQEYRIPIRIYKDPETGNYIREKLPRIPSLPNTMLSKEAYKLYKNLESLRDFFTKKSIQSIYKKSRTLLKYFMKFNEEIEYDIDCLFIAATYYREVFYSMPYIQYYSKRFGSGKTRGMRCLIWSSYHGITWVIPTEAPMFRIIEDVGATLGIDELHKYYYRDKRGYIQCTNNDLAALLTTGYKKGEEVPRCRKDNFDIIDQFRVFGGKSFTRLEGVIPQDLESRSITHVMIPSSALDDISPNDPIKDDFKEIRDAYYLYSLELILKVEETYHELLELKIIEGRIGELYYPLLTMAKVIFPNDDSLYNAVLQKAKNHYEELWGERDPFVDWLYRAILKSELWGDRVLLTEIVKAFNDCLVEENLIKEDKKKKNSTVGKYFLLPLGFKKSRYHKGNKTHYNIELNTLLRNLLSFYPHYTQYISNQLPLEGQIK
ncbi:MAG: bifunctional DNA primase/polymerase [Promethearchaeota archaeon]